VKATCLNRPRRAILPVRDSICTLLEMALRATPAQTSSAAAASVMEKLSVDSNQSCHLMVRASGRGLIIQRQGDAVVAALTVPYLTRIDDSAPTTLHETCRAASSRASLLGRTRAHRRQAVGILRPELQSNATSQALGDAKYWSRRFMKQPARLTDVDLR